MSATRNRGRYLAAGADRGPFWATPEAPREWTGASIVDRSSALGSTEGCIVSVRASRQPLHHFSCDRVGVDAVVRAQPLQAAVRLAIGIGETNLHEPTSISRFEETLGDCPTQTTAD